MLMTSQKIELPRLIDARKLVQREQNLTGIVPRDSLPRLASSVESVVEDARAELSFTRDLERNQTVSGSLQLKVQRICQRCLQPVIEKLEAELAWGVVWTEEQGHKLPKFLDPVLQEDDELDLYQVLEDEILLNLPAMAYHDEECVDRDKFSSGRVLEDTVESPENPFKVLEQLKISTNKP